MKRKTWMSTVVAVALLSTGLVGWVSGAAGSDPEPYISPDLQYHFDPGPGWPAGWEPPATPTELTPEAREEFEFGQAMTPPGEVRPERLEFRVLSPLPAWTKEYPYYWVHEMLYCGAAAYAYYYPRPDTGLIHKTYDESYSVGKSGSGGNCKFGPVNTISLNRKRTPEEQEQFDLGNLVDRDVQLARGKLEACHEDVIEGAFDNIHVCFNYGNASARFDVPAYLDASVGRVRVPIRFVSEMMGAEVTWDQATETVTIRLPAVSREIVQPEMLPGYTPVQMWRENAYTLAAETFKWKLVTVTQPAKTIVLRVGSDLALVDGQEVKIDAPPVVLPPGRTMVPVRFVAEALGAKVYWVGNEPIFLTSAGGLGGRNQVHIFTPLLPYFAAPDWFLETRAMKF